MNKIAILTSGGDSPGMNSAIRSVVRCALSKEVSVVGVSHGYQGLIEKRFCDLGRRDVSNIITRGGTFLKTARSKEFYSKKGRKKAHQNMSEKGIDGLVVIGGDGTFKGALVFHQEFDFSVTGIPATIDNDIAGTQETLGFDTALNTAMDAIDKIRDTAYSMDRIFLVEVMGRKSGAIAVHSALAGGAEDLLIPEMEQSVSSVLKKVQQGREAGKKSWIIIVAEGSGKTLTLAQELREHIDDVRVTVIGHVQRGGSPSAFDRILGARMGSAAVQSLLQGKKHHAVGWFNDRPVTYPLQKAIQHKQEDFSEFIELVQILT
ncbi:MAG: 6-phosphofructokinase [Candidatus Aminicenantes bacterium]|nr:6-phosphofructokinase [Candidatus Aminicenantes bacterium]